MKTYYLFIFIVLVATSTIHAQEHEPVKDTLKTFPQLSPSPKLKPNPRLYLDTRKYLELSPDHHKELPKFDFNYKNQRPSFFQRSSPYLLPAGLMAVSLFSLSEASQETFLNKFEVQHLLQTKLQYNFTTSIDDYSMHAPLAITAGLKLAGIKGTNDAINTILLAAKSHLLCSIIVTSLKKHTAIERPDHSSFTSFPSGHTSTAFVNATIMHMEFGDINPWYSVLGYGIATATGALRMMNNVHWLPDVLAGAAIGIATTRLVYATHKYRWGKLPKNLVVAPTYSNKHLGLALAYFF